MHIVFGLTRLLLGIWVGIYAFNFKEVKKDSFLTNYPTATKILAIVLVLSGVNSVFFGKGDYNFLNSSWSTEEIDILVQNCV